MSRNTKTGGEVSTARPPTTKSPFLLLMTNRDTRSSALHPQNQLPDSGSVHESQRQQLWLSSLHRSPRRTCCVRSCLECFTNSVELSGTIHLSRRPKIFMRAAIKYFKILGEDFAKRAHFRPSEIFGDFLGNIFTRKKWNKILLGKSWARSRFLYKILFP